MGKRTRTALSSHTHPVSPNQALVEVPCCYHRYIYREKTQEVAKSTYAAVSSQVSFVSSAALVVVALAVAPAALAALPGWHLIHHRLSSCLQASAAATKGAEVAKAMHESVLASASSLSSSMSSAYSSAYEQVSAALKKAK